MWNLGLGLLAVLLFSVKKGSLPSPGARGREEKEGGDRFVLAGELVKWKRGKREGEEAEESGMGEVSAQRVK